MSTHAFLQTVEYANYPSAFLQVKSFDKYNFGINYENLDQHQTYIIEKDKGYIFANDGYSVTEFGNFAVARIITATP